MQISVSSQTSLLNPANFLVFALYDASAPAVLLESQAPAKPYGDPLQITFLHNCVAGHVYIIKLWESVDDTPTGSERNSFNMTVNNQRTTVRLPEYLVVDVTDGLVADTTTYVNLTYNGWDYTVERVGQGTLYPQVAPAEINYEQDDAGGFHLTLPGDVFQPSEKFVAQFVPQVADGGPAGTPSAPFSTGRIITTDETLAVDDLNKALFLQGEDSSLIITLPALSMVQDYIEWVYLYSIAGSHINAIIDTNEGDRILYNTELLNIILGQCEILKLFKANDVWNVDYAPVGVKAVGELVYNYGKTELNTIECAGQELQRADYPRLWAYIQTLESACIVMDTLWNTTTTVLDGITYYINKGKFSTGNGTSTFRMPLLYNKFIRVADGTTRLPGNLQTDADIQHSHDTIVGAIPSLPNGSGPSHPVRGLYNGSGTGITDLTGLMYNPTVAGNVGGVLQRQANETRPVNIATYCLMRI